MCTIPPCARPGCNHDWADHAHYRVGDECALCPECPGYQRRRPVFWLQVAAAIPAAIGGVLLGQRAADWLLKQRR